MNIIYRSPPTTQGTFGIWFIDNAPFCVTLERPAEGDHPCIKPGTYQCDRFHSPHNGNCWLLKGTEPRTMIQIHVANRYTELLGCIAPGRRFGTLEGIPAVLESAYAMADLYKKNGDHFKLTIVGG